MTIKEIKAIFDANNTALEQCAGYLNYTPDLMNKELMEQITSKDKSLEQSSFALFLSNVFCDDQDMASFFYREYYSKGIVKLNPDVYESNPYYKSIKIPETTVGKWTLGYQSYKPYEAFVCNEYIAQGYKEIPCIGFFDRAFSFPTVYENGVEWMAIKPNEIETMKKPIENAKGNVLVCGLGLGYFAYMISLKDEVASVTVVERDESVIELFEKYILPQFENAHKIRIVKSDALEYIKNVAPSQELDYAFVDLWHDVSDGVKLYIDVRKLEAISKIPQFDYWIEHMILSSIRTGVFGSFHSKIESGEIQKTDTEMQKILKYDYIKELSRYL